MQKQPYVGCNRHAKVIYVAGPYSTGCPDELQENVFAARRAGAQLMAKGHTPIVPHTNFDYAGQEQWRSIMDCCLDLIHRVDAVFMLPGWERSLGARAERYAAYATGRTVYYDLQDVPDIKHLLPKDDLCEVPNEYIVQASSRVHNQ